MRREGTPTGRTPAWMQVVEPRLEQAAEVVGRRLEQAAEDARSRPAKAGIHAYRDVRLRRNDE